MGGHSNTVEAPTSDGPIPVDTGFIVYNERTYPNLIGLFEHLQVPVKKTDMTEKHLQIQRGGPSITSATGLLSKTSKGAGGVDGSIELAGYYEIL